MVTIAMAPTAARACNDPYIAVTPGTAGPGDTVYWTLANVDPGATYSDVQAAGRTVAPGGVVPPGKVHGSFIMPDLGDEQVAVHLTTDVSHQGAFWPAAGELQYAPPSPGGTTTLPPGEELGVPPPGGGPSGGDDPDRAAAPDRPAGDRRGRGGGRDETSPRTKQPTVTHEEPARTKAPVESPAHVVVDPDVAVPVLAATPAAAGSPEAVDRLGRDRPRRVRPAFVPAPERVAAPVVAERAPPRAKAPGKEDAPLVPLLVIAAVGALAVGLALLPRWRGDAAAPAVAPRLPWIPPQAAIEAELQEIVAEERMKRFEREHGRDMAEPGEPVRAGPP